MTCTVDYGNWLFLNNNLELAADYFSWSYIMTSAFINNPEAAALKVKSEISLSRLNSGLDYFGNFPGFVPVVTQSSIAFYLDKLESSLEAIDQYVQSLEDHTKEAKSHISHANSLIQRYQQRLLIVLENQVRLGKERNTLEIQMQSATQQMLAKQKEVLEIAGELSQSANSRIAKMMTDKGKFRLNVLKILPSVLAVATMGPAGLGTAGLLNSFKAGASTVMGTVTKLVKGRFEKLTSIGDSLKSLVQDTENLVTVPSKGFGEQKRRFNGVFTSAEKIFEEGKSFLKPLEGKETEFLEKFKEIKSNAEVYFPVKREEYQLMTNFDMDGALAGVEDQALIAKYRSHGQDFKVALEACQQLALQLHANEAALSNLLVEYKTLQSLEKQSKSIIALSRNERLFALTELAVQSLQLLREDYIYNMYLRHKTLSYEAFSIGQPLPRFFLPNIERDSLKSLKISRAEQDAYVEAVRRGIGQGSQSFSCTPDMMIWYNQSSSTVQHLQKGLLQDNHHVFSVDVPILSTEKAFNNVADVKVDQVSMVIIGFPKELRVVCEEVSGKEVCLDDRTTDDIADHFRQAEHVTFLHPGNPVEVMNVCGKTALFSHKPRSATVNIPFLKLPIDSLDDHKTKNLVFEQFVNGKLKGSIASELGTKNHDDPYAPGQYLKPSPFTTWKLTFPERSVPERVKSEKWEVKGVAMCFSGTFRPRVDCLIDD